MEHVRRRNTVIGDDASPTEVASYIAEMVTGLRHLSNGKEALRFLDQLLAVAEQEAKTMALHSYN